MGKLRKNSVLMIILLLIISILSGCSGKSNDSNTKEESNAETSSQKYDGTITLAVSSWTGYAPLYVAVDKGFFKKEGADVKIQEIQSPGDRKTAFAANRIQGMASTVDTHVMTAAAGIDIIQVLAFDTSDGGDGVVAKKEIKSLSDLKGKTVACDTTSTDYFWFNYLLEKEGMSISDVTVQNMSSGDAGSAFVAGKVDAAVTWQPWLTNASKTNFGHVLVSSKTTPGVIVDTLGVSREFAEKYPDSVQAIINGWYDALEFTKTNPDEANAIMAKAMGQTVAEFTATLPDVKFYDEAGNKEYFGTADKKGLIYNVNQQAADLWYKTKLISSKPDIDKLIDGSFVNK